MTEEESFPESEKSSGSPNQIFFATNTDKSNNSAISKLFLPSPEKSKISDFQSQVDYPNSLLSSEQSGKISKPQLRRKICSKLAKTFQSTFGIEKLLSQQLTLQLEAKIRSKYPDMDDAYKSTLRKFIRFLRVFLLI